MSVKAQARFALPAPSVAALAGVIACGAASPERADPVVGASQAPAPSSGPTALPSASSTSPAVVPPDDANARAVALALHHVGTLRALQPKGSVTSRTLPRHALAELVRGHIAREVPAEVVSGSAELLFGLGLVPANFDYVASILAFMSSELAGLYEPVDDTMYLAEDLEPSARDATLNHELVHALQDQHYDLGTSLEYAPDKGDAQAALHCLAEGDATSLMLDAVLAPQGAKAVDVPDAAIRMQVLAAIELGAVAASVPSIIRRSAVAPYIDGIQLVHALRRSGGWAAVDAAWRSPPTTTEQVLHPEKFAAREPAEALPMPPAPEPTGWRLSFSDVLGEQAYKLLFEEWLPATAAAEAASGWAGDRVAVYRSGDASAIALTVRWDDENGAIRGHAALTRGAVTADARDPKETALLAISRGNPCREVADRGAIATARRGRNVAVVIGPFDHRGGTATGRGTCVAARRWAGLALAF